MTTECLASGPSGAAFDTCATHGGRINVARSHCDRVDAPADTTTTEVAVAIADAPRTEAPDLLMAARAVVFAHDHAPFQDGLEYAVTKLSEAIEGLSATPAPERLDVETLAQAWWNVVNEHEEGAWKHAPNEHTDNARSWAVAIAAEYARLRESGSEDPR